MTNDIVPMEKVKRYMLSPEVKERFADMMGANGIYYLNQVLILVANNPRLQECTPQSILIAAMRAASLKLSVDPARGEAWIIPYKGKATFQLGYRGVYELAMRTDQYRHINVIDVYEGFELQENIMTGNHEIIKSYRDGAIVGYMLYFKLFNGFEKTYYMTVEEIEHHAARYSQSYNNSDSPWNDKENRRKMMRKTVLSNGLRRWGRFNSGDADVLAEIEEAQEWHDFDLPEEGEVTVIEENNVPAEENAARLMGNRENNAPISHSIAPVKQTVKPASVKHNSGSMTVEEAEAEWSNTAGATYGTLETDALNMFRVGLAKAKNRTAEQERKLHAINLIIEAREKGHAVQVAPEPETVGTPDQGKLV